MSIDPARVAATLARGRAAAEALMGAANGASDARIRRRTGQTTTLPGGKKVPEWTVVRSDEPFMLGDGGQNTGGTRTVTDGDTDVQVPLRTGHFSVAIDDDLRDGDYVEITAGANTGQVYRVIEATSKDRATARRVPLVGTTRPAEWETP